MATRMFVAPPPAPAPPPAAAPAIIRLGTMRFVSPLNASHLVIPVLANAHPSVTLPGAVSIATAAQSGNTQAQGFVQSTTQAAASAPQSTAAANAQMLALGDRIAVQKQYVTKYYGAAAAAPLTIGAHLATPAVRR